MAESSKMSSTMQWVAPPGWPQPPAWWPPPHWQPDPAWGPPPADWQWWQPVGAARAVRRERRRAYLLFWLLAVPPAGVFLGIGDERQGLLPLVLGLGAALGWLALVAAAFRRAGRADVAHWFHYACQRTLRPKYGTDTVQWWRHRPWS